ncbi:MAG: helix-turn-helix domain-containing protein, partial [Allomuricauda sp.]
EAKDLLLNHPFLSVKAVMYEVGFNSKTSFYSAFKKETGVSPNDFRSLTGSFAS